MFCNFCLDVLIGCAIKVHVNSVDWVALILARKLPEKYETIVPLSIKTEVLRKCFTHRLMKMFSYNFSFSDRWSNTYDTWLRTDILSVLTRPWYKAETFFLSVALWVQFATGGFHYQDRHHWHSQTLLSVSVWFAELADRTAFSVWGLVLLSF